MFVTRNHIDELLKDAPQVRQTTRGLLFNFMWDLPLSMAQADDFGIISAEHYRALRSVMEALIEKKDLVTCAVELDQAMGHGAQLTQMVRTYAPEYEVTFSTIWDQLYGRI